MSIHGEIQARGSAQHHDDVALVQRARAGAVEAIDVLCERLSCVPAMLREMHRRHGSPLDAEELNEIEQETLMAIWAKLAQFEGRASLETWAYRFTFHELLKGLDRRRRGRRMQFEEAATLDRCAQVERDEPLLDPRALESTLDRIGPPACEIIRLRHFHELSFEEIARRHGEPLNTVKARYYRGLARLKDLLQPQLRSVVP